MAVGGALSGGGIDAQDKSVTIEYVMDGGGQALTTGVKGYLEVPFRLWVLRWTLAADQVGSVVLDIWDDTYANFPPTIADSITGTEQPTLAGQQANQATTLAGWTRTLNVGDIMAYNIVSVSSIQRLTASLLCRRIG